MVIVAIAHDIAYSEKELVKESSRNKTNPNLMKVGVFVNNIFILSLPSIQNEININALHCMMFILSLLTIKTN
jgi:hypothetical protein